MFKTVLYLITLFRQGFPCLFHLLTGLYCPGCGGTRASVYLLRGELLRSFQYHPLVPYMALVAVLELAGFAASKILHNPRLHVKRYTLFTYVGIGIVIVNWMWKNYNLIVRGIDLLP